MSMPPCGCRTGCQHRDHPGLPAQHRCRLGYVPGVARPLAAKWSQPLTGQRKSPPMPSETVARMLGVELQPWQATILDRVLVLPPWPERPDTDRVRVEAVLSPEQTARARWGSWRDLRTTDRPET